MTSIEPEPVAPLPTTAGPPSSKPRLIIALEHDQHKTIKIFAAEHSVTMAMLVRGIFECFLTRLDWQRAVMHRIRPE